MEMSDLLSTDQQQEGFTSRFDTYAQNMSPSSYHLQSQIDMWQPQDTRKESEFENEMNGLQVNDTVRENFGKSNENETSVVEAREGVLQEHWVRIKSIFGNMKSILEQMYPSGGSDKMSFSVFDKAIAFGDQMHLLGLMRDTFDGELLAFLMRKWEDVQDNLFNSYPLLKVLISSNTRDIGTNLLMALVRQVGHVLHNQAFTHISELDFVTELMRSSGFKDEEIYEVFKLLDLPTYTVENNEALAQESRQASFGSYTLDKSGGYGHSGGGGGYGGGGYGGGYGYMQSFDPFVLLAGLAFATFLAYLIYRLLSSTTAARRREVPDISLALDLSDLPGVVGNIHSWLEKTENRYGRSGWVSKYMLL